MAELLYNLLTEPIFSVIRDEGAASATLPEVFAALANGEPLEFTALQPHQFHAWHAFLVQLGALAVFRAGTAHPAALSEAPQWAAALRALCDARDEPWCLVVPDLGAPAFMQPPVPEGSIARWKDENATTTPDTIDLLQTAKNHDVKMQRIAAPRPEHWVYALVSLQTMQGFSGRDNYGIARMNGGVSNRPAFATARDLGWATRFQREVDLLLATRGEIAANHSFDAETGRALLWLESWDGLEQLGVEQLDPFFIEICRRIRLVQGRDRIIARWTTTKATRIAAKEIKGNTGDAWTPVRREDGAALTAPDLNYRLVQRVIFGSEFEPSPASRPRAGDGDEPLLACQIFVRGQGKTDGYYERYIPIPPRARLLFVTEAGRQKLGALAKRRLDEVKSVASEALRPALAALLQGGADRLDFRDPRLDALAQSFDREVDRVFFAELFDDIDLSFEPARVKWLEQLLRFARQTLDQARQSAPIPAARVLRANAAADRIFNGASYRLRAAAGESFEQPGGAHESSNV